jgi:hypothetical protein
MLVRKTLCPRLAIASAGAIFAIRAVFLKFAAAL